MKNLLRRFYKKENFPIVPFSTLRCTRKRKSLRKEKSTEIETNSDFILFPLAAQKALSRQSKVSDNEKPD